MTEYELFPIICNEVIFFEVCRNTKYASFAIKGCSVFLIFSFIKNYNLNSNQYYTESIRSHVTNGKVINHPKMCNMN